MALNLILSAAKTPEDNATPLRKIDLVTYFRKVRVSTNDKLTDEEQLFEKSYFKLGFDSATIDGAYLYKDFPLRTAPRAKCSIIKVNLSPGKEFIQVGSSYTPGIYHAKSENTAYFDASSCVGGYKRTLTGIVFYQQDDEIAVGVPYEYIKELPFFQLPPPFGIYMFEEIEEIRSVMPVIIAEYAPLAEGYAFFSESGVIFSTIKLASTITGKYYLEEERDEALNDVISQRLSSASFIGVSAQAIQIIKYGVIILMILMYDLWRKVRLLSKTQKTLDEYWVAYDAADVFGFCGALVFGAVPVIFSIIALTLFAHAQGVGIVILGYFVEIESILRLEFKKAPPPGWLGHDVYYTFLLLPSAFFVILGGLTSFELVRMSWTVFRSRRLRSKL